jgi:hypothetical protein
MLIVNFKRSRLENTMCRAYKFNDVGLVSTVKCCVCTIIERKEIFLVAMWDSIEKHVGKKKGSNGKWIMDPNGCTLKMRSFMFSFLQPIISNS